ncbi:MAG TPA: alpha-(1-_3)-arabinofuranosyltransferase family protein, partial [Thermoleophilaceae bacterium]|nr:alpha-(1->3)-arabinofuranosyltransferase family protein [Thermoleophilaceae bacterium]
MRDPRSRAIPLGLAAAAMLAALLQRPGETSADTKIDLHVDPVGFLGDVMSVWTNSGALGEVQGGQYAGYLFPMGPFFALGHLLGLPDWLVDRLWIGVILALAAWGTVRLLDALMPGPRGAAHVVAGALMVFNPYTVVY